MPDPLSQPEPPPATRTRQLRAYLVHAYTASGIAFAFLAAAELMKVTTDPRVVLAWLTAAVLVDATDGPLARRCHVRKYAPAIHGRTIDDIVDYITFTFLPLMLVWRMQWLPAGSAVFVVLVMMASLFGFANVKAKFENEGFFLGFPSYWNIYAFYAGLIAVRFGTWPPLFLMLLLGVLTLAPVRFIYPNRIEQPWRAIVLAGAGLWLVLLLVMLPGFPHAPAGLFWLSLLYPAIYGALSVWLDIKHRRQFR